MSGIVVSLVNLTQSKSLYSGLNKVYRLFLIEELSNVFVANLCQMKQFYKVVDIAGWDYFGVEHLT